MPVMWLFFQRAQGIRFLPLIPLPVYGGIEIDADPLLPAIGVARAEEETTAVVAVQGRKLTGLAVLPGPELPAEPR